MTMPTLPRILASSSLCLAAVGLSSCISRMHRVAYEYPRSYEGAWLENNNVPKDGNAANMKLTKRLHVYECDGQWYLPVSRICYTKKVIQVEPTIAYLIDNVSHEDKQQYYLPISPEFAGKLRTASRHKSSQRELTDYITQTKLLASLPSQAKAYPVLMPIGGEENGDLLVQTDAHVGPSAILAYPAAAVLFVVDIPVTVASTTVAILGVITSILLNGDIVH